jgi:hypothetical protein
MKDRSDFFQPDDENGDDENALNYLRSLLHTC